MRGLFQLTTPGDLLAKLRHDYQRLLENPKNPYTAFDFFVTAEHMLDWIYPGAAGKNARTAERNSHTILQIVSHLATGAKHMVPEHPRHASVQHADVGPIPYGTGRYGQGPYGGDALMIELEGDAEATFAKSITATQLAAEVLAYWQGHAGCHG